MLYVTFKRGLNDTTGGIWKRRVISTLDLTNPSPKRSFSKTLFNPKEFENAGFSFSCGRKPFWKRSWRYSCDFPDRVLFKHKSKTWRPAVINTCLKIPSAFGGQKTCHAFSDWKLSFQIPQSCLVWTGVNKHMIMTIHSKVTLTYCRFSIKIWARLFNFVCFHWNFVILWNPLGPLSFESVDFSDKINHIYPQESRAPGHLNNEFRYIPDLASLREAKITSSHEEHELSVVPYWLIKKFEKPQHKVDKTMSKMAQFH